MDVESTIQPELNEALSEFDTPAVVRIDCADAEEFSEQLSDWSVELTHLYPGPFVATALLIPLGAVLVARASYSNPIVDHNCPPPGCFSIGRPGRGSDPMNHLGRAIEDGQVMVCGPGGEIENVSLGTRCPTTLSVRCDLLAQEADWLTHATLLSKSGGAQVREPGVAWTTSYLDAMEWVVDAVERYSEATARADVRGSLVDLLLARVDMLAAATAPLHTDRQARAHRRRAVERARYYIARNLTEPIRLSDLSRHALTQARSLEYGFREVLGVSPMAYVRATRLQRVRRLLRTTAVRTRSVSEIALDCGFWHLSQFAMDYKVLFGESPSVTYRRTEAQLPRSERRRRASMGPRVVASKTTARPLRNAAALPC